MVIVETPSSSLYYNVYTLTSLPSGSSLVITNNTSEVLYVNQSATQPSENSTQYPVQNGKTVVVNGNNNSVWIMASKGPIIIQSYDSIISNSEMIDPRVYIGTQAFTVQSFIEANCKNGVQYQLATYNPTFTAGSTTDFIVTTGSKPVLIKNRHFQFDGSLITTTVYKNPTFTGGTIVPYYNMSDINPVAGLAVIRALPTVTVAGTQFSPTATLIGSVPQGGQALTATDAESDIEGLERVLAPNTNYLFRTVNAGTTCRVSTISSWFEGDLSSTAF